MSYYLASKLRPYVEAIQQDAKEGDIWAKQIAAFYALCPENSVAEFLCEGALAEWLTRKEEQSCCRYCGKPPRAKHHCDRWDCPQLR